MSYSIISNLIRQQECVLWHRYTEGTCYDFSGNGNVGTPSAGCSWEGGGIRFPTGTDEVTVADAASLRLTAGTLMVVGPLDGDQGVGATNGVFIAKRNVAAVPNYQLFYNNTTLLCYDGTSTRSIAATMRGARSVAMTFEHTGTPIAYINGLSIGNFSGTINVIPNNEIVEIGNRANLSVQARSPFHHALICNRILTATEIAALHGELVR